MRCGRMGRRSVGARCSSLSIDGEWFDGWRGARIVWRRVSLLITSDLLVELCAPSEMR